MYSIEDICYAVLCSLTDEVRQPAYKGSPSLKGYSHVVAEAIYFMNKLVGPKLHLDVETLMHEGVAHYYLLSPYQLIDPTRGQFRTFPPYHCANGCVFMDMDIPSKTAQKVIARATVVLENREHVIQAEQLHLL
jgi:hypothetical protein